MKSPQQKKAIQILGLGVVALIGITAAFYLFPFFRERIGAWIGPADLRADDIVSNKSAPAELISKDSGEFGLRLSKEAIESFEVQPFAAILADRKLPLPPIMGTVNYDNDRLFTIRPRFQGEVAAIAEVDYSEYPQGEKKKRPLRFGDRMKQGDSLAVLWCRDLGEKKAALVDAISSLNLSQETLERHRKLFDDAAISLSLLKQSERQVRADSNAVLTAERTLRIWKLSDKEIQDVKDEAKVILDQKTIRDPDKEKYWAEVKVPVPTYSRDPNRRLVVVEKNVNVNDMVDPSRDMPLFRLADLSRLQIWAHPPEEYLPLFREHLKNGPGCLKWEVRFQSDPPNSPPKLLDVAMVSPSLEANQHTPMLIGYLDNPDGKYLIGQFVTATIFVPPPMDENKQPNAVEIPTAAINPMKGQNLVFVQDPAAPREFTLRRVAIVQSTKKSSLVRSKLTPEDQDISVAEVKQGRLPIQALHPGECVITRGVVELTEALDDLRGQRKDDGPK
jgi:cobalt-zinc-cadmium efflux system membrane fusion protein